PPNDACDYAIDLGAMPATIQGDNSMGTDDIGFACVVSSGPYKNLWYTVTGTGNTITATTCSASTTFDTKIAVYCNSCDNHPICVNGNDDDSSCTYSSLHSTAQWCSILGEVYYVTVGCYSATTTPGVFELIVTDDGVTCLDPVPCNPCIVTCPMGGILEGEPCGTDNNGGCNMLPDTPLFVDMECGDLYCGNAWADGGSRDTDWYQVVLTEPRRVTFEVDAEFDNVIGVAETDPWGSDDCANSTGYLAYYALGTACEPVSLEVVLTPGTYWFLVLPDDYYNLPCSWGPWRYTAELTCEELQVPAFNPAGILVLLFGFGIALKFAYRRKR
ncbi:hypothetical protein JW905_09710, partial [bacterium]|nr:hypothetical protein [candidate division CSSED10-310 bacterium]